MFANEGAMLVATLVALVLSPSAAQPSMLKQKTVAEVEEPMWTVVHPKHRGGSPMVLAHVSQEPEKDEPLQRAVEKAVEPVKKAVNTLKDRIWQMGRDMCKDRAASDHCKRFGITAEDEDSEEDQEAQSEDLQKQGPAMVPVPAPAPAVEKEEEESGAPAPASASSPASETKESKRQDKGEAEEEEKAEENEEDEPMETTPKPPKLQSQGFRGKKVRHLDGKTATGDWGDEYGHERRGHRHEERSHARSAMVLKSFTTLWTSLLVMCGILYNF